jgi:PAS domain S-box-containing protein
MLSKNYSSVVGKLLGLVIVILGLTVIYGWYTQDVSLIQINKNFAPMQFNTALCFILIGLALLFECIANKASITLVLISFTISSLTLIEYIFHIDLIIDQMVMKHYIMTKSSHAGRMAPNTAICFTLSSISLLYLCLKHNKEYFLNISSNLVLLILFLSVSAFMGYLTDVPSSYGWRDLTEMALHTSIGFIIFSLGMILIITSYNYYIFLNYSKSTLVVGVFVLLFYWFNLQSNLDKGMMESIRKYGESLKLKTENAIENQFSAVQRLFLRVESKSYRTKNMLDQDVKYYMQNMPSIVSIQVGYSLNEKYEVSRLNKKSTSNILYLCGRTDTKEVFRALYITKTFEYKNNSFFCLVSQNKKNILVVNALNLLKKVLGNSYRNNISIELDEGNNRRTSLFGNNESVKKDKEIEVSLNDINTNWKLILTPEKSFVYFEIYRMSDFFLFLGAVLVILLAFSLKLWEKSIANYMRLQSETREKEKTESRFRAVLESSPALIFIVNKDGLIVFSTNQCEKLLGYTADELKMKEVEMLIQDEHTSTHEKYRKDYFKNPTSKRMGDRSDLRVLTKDRKEVPVEITLTPIDMDGQIHVLCMIIDISIKINLEKEKQNVSQMKIINKCAKLASEADSLEEGMKNCLDAICQHMKWPVGHILFISSSGTFLSSSKIWHISNNIEIDKFKYLSEEVTFEADEGLPGRIWTSKKPSWIENIFNDDNFPRAKLGAEAKIQSGAGFPVLLNNKVIAILEFFDLNIKLLDKAMLGVFNVLAEQMSRIFEKKIATDNLEESERRNRLLLESAGEGIYGLDLDGVTTFVNPAALTMLGYSAQELIGHKMHPTVHYAYPDGKKYPKEKCPMYAAYKDGKIHRVTNEVLWRKDGTPLWVEYISSPVYQKNKITGAVVIFNDISDRIEADKKIERYAEQLEESNKELDDFAYIASHDLKEPLRGISNFSKILLEDYGEKLDAMGKQELETLIRLSDKMTGLLSSLLTYSRVGRVALSFQETDLHSILTEQQDLLQSMLKDENVEIVEKTRLPTILCDKVRVGEVFYNLIVNGIKYNNSKEKKIFIDFQENDVEYTFVVEDNGIGMLESDYHKIFQIFKRLHSDKEYEGGTGVGMTIIEKIVKKHDGKIWLKSVVGVGTKVFFTIPKKI